MSLKARNLLFANTVINSYTAKHGHSRFQFVSLANQITVIGNEISAYT